MSEARPEPTQQAFWDERYRKPGEAFGTAPNVWLSTQGARFKRGDRVLVPGDGEGRNGVWLAGLGLNVETVDASPQAVENARAFAASRGVTIDAKAADLTTWDWPVARYDAAVSIYVHFKPEIRAAMHAKMLAALKPGGLVLIEAYGPGQLSHHAAGSVGGPKTVEGVFSIERLRADFAGCEMLELTDAETVLDEGVRHRGPSSVVRMVARKR